MGNTGQAKAEHITPLKIYLGTGAALFILTAATVGISFINLGGWNAIAAVAIATIKAALVAFIFMHLLYDKKIFLIVFTVALMFLGILISLTMFDVLSRGDVNEITASPISQEAPMYKNMPLDTSAHEGSNETESEGH